MTKDELIEQLKTEVREAENADRLVTLLHLLRIWLSLSPQSMALKARYADTQRRLGSIIDAEQPLRECINTVEPERKYWVEISLGLLYQSLGKHDITDRFFRAAAASSPKSTTPALTLGNFLLAHGRAAEAREHFTHALNVAEDQDDLLQARLSLGNLERSLGNRAAATTHFKTAAAIDPANQSATVALGDIEFALRQHDEFSDAVTACATSAPHPDGKTELRERLLHAINQADDAHYPASLIVLRRMLLTLDPKNTSLTARHAADLDDMGHITEAESLLKDCMIAFPPEQKWYAEYQLADLYRRVGKYDLAEPLFRARTVSDPNSTAPWVFLGAFLSGSGRLAEACEVFQRGLEAEGDIDEVHVNLGNIQRALGDYPSALHHYEIACTLNPDDGPARDSLNDIRHALTRAPQLRLWADSFSQAG